MRGAGAEEGDAVGGGDEEVAIIFLERFAQMQDVGFQPTERQTDETGEKLGDGIDGEFASAVRSGEEDDAGDIAARLEVDQLDEACLQVGGKVELFRRGDQKLAPQVFHRRSGSGGRR